MFFFGLVFYNFSKLHHREKTYLSDFQIFDCFAQKKDATYTYMLCCRLQSNTSYLLILVVLLACGHPGTTSSSRWDKKEQSFKINPEKTEFGIGRYLFFITLIIVYWPRVRRSSVHYSNILHTLVVYFSCLISNEPSPGSIPQKQ